MGSRGGVTASDRVLVAVCGGVSKSVTWTAMVLVPCAVGVPVMAPVFGLIERPLGRPPAVQVYGVTPPVAATVALYAWPAAPEGSEVVVIVSVDGLIVSGMLAVAVWAVGVEESDTLTVMFPLLVPVGVPVIAPVVGLRLKPLGNPNAAQEYGVAPPVAASVAE